MKKKDLAKYIKNRIENKCYSKLVFHKAEITHYFRHRHRGLAGIDGDMVADLCRGAIRDYRVWKEIDATMNYNNK